MKEAFQINSYLKEGILYSDSPINLECFNTIQVDKDKMLLMGRALTDFSSGDKLYTTSGDSVTILYFYLYGHKMDFICGGCTCIILCTPILSTPTLNNEILYLH